MARNIIRSPHNSIYVGGRALKFEEMEESDEWEQLRIRRQGSDGEKW